MNKKEDTSLHPLCDIAFKMSAVKKRKNQILSVSHLSKRFV